MMHQWKFFISLGLLRTCSMATWSYLLVYMDTPEVVFLLGDSVVVVLDTASRRKYKASPIWKLRTRGVVDFTTLEDLSKVRAQLSTSSIWTNKIRKFKKFFINICNLQQTKVKFKRDY